MSKVPAIAYGLSHEAVALERFRSQMGLQVIRKAGFFICNRYPYLGATPDDIIPSGDENENKSTEECLLEIKCPYAHRFTGTASDYLILREDGEYELNKKHNYNYQVHGKLYVCEKEMCILWYIPFRDSLL